VEVELRRRNVEKADQLMNKRNHSGKILPKHNWFGLKSEFIFSLISREYFYFRENEPSKRNLHVNVRITCFNNV